MAGIPITEGLELDESEIELTAIRAAGPGGQNVNKVASAIHLRFDIAASSLPERCKARLLAGGDQRISSEGVLVLKGQRFRSQEKNRADCIERLVGIVRAALKEPKPRRATRPTAASRRRRLESKERRAQVKQMRKKVDPD